MMPKFKRGPSYFLVDLLWWVLYAFLAGMASGFLLYYLMPAAHGQEIPGASIVRPPDFPVEYAGFYRDLGRELFRDPELSASGTISCATCHDAAKNFTDGRDVAIGNFGKDGNRNTPTCRNTGYWTPQFWAGQADGLETQAEGPVENPLEMADADGDGDADQTFEQAVRRVEDKYRDLFKNKRFFPIQARWALAEYQRSLSSGVSDYDVWVGNGTIDAPMGPVTAMNASARRGAKIFSANCKQCHIPPVFSDAPYSASPFHVTGTSSSGDDDNGRQGVTTNLDDFKKYKTPSLRDVYSTAPYMHAGNFKSLEAVVNFYNEGAGVAVRSDGATLKSGLLPPPGFLRTTQDRADLLEFLRALTTRGELTQ